MRDYCIFQLHAFGFKFLVILDEFILFPNKRGKPLERGPSPPHRYPLFYEGGGCFGKKIKREGL